MKADIGIQAYIQSIVDLSEKEADEFNKSFEEKKIKKRQFIVQPNFTNRHRYFVLKGAFRSYAVTDDGREQTLQFGIENWWVSDFNSYLYQQPATLFIVALEDSVVLQLDYEKEQELKRRNHKYETFFRVLAEKGLAFEHRRILSNATQSAEERYENFLIDFPQFVQRAPQYAIASYLGMTTQFLSRIKNKRASQKS